MRYDASTTGMPMKYVRHVLTDGAPCTMTGAKRSSEVRFTCLPQHTENLLVLVKVRGRREILVCKFHLSMQT